MVQGSGVISFDQLRKTAQAVKQVQWGQKGNHIRLSNVLCGGLLADLGSESVDVKLKVESLLAVIEFQRVSELHLNLDAAFAGIAQLIDSDKSNLVKHTLDTQFNDEERLNLIDWLIHVVGSRASAAMVDQISDKKGRKAREWEDRLKFESPAVLLHCLCQLSQESKYVLPSSYFHVVALDVYIKQNKSAVEMIQSCSRFNAILSLPTKLDLLYYNFELQRNKQDREQMYADIYAGGNYQRNSSRDTTRMRVLTIDRAHILRDSMELLKGAGTLFHGVYIKFEGEEGQDAGGLIKEWMLVLGEQLSLRIFCQDEQGADRSGVKASCSYEEAELMGIVIGLSIMQRIALDISIPRFVYRRLLSQPTSHTLEELAEVRPSLAKGLSEMLLWEEKDFSERLSLNFTFQISHDVDVILTADGDKVPVTYFNRDVYVQRLCKYLLEEQVEVQLDALHHGFERVCGDLNSLQMFSIEQIHGLVCGEEIPLSVATLKRVCTVDATSTDDGYLDQFWNVLEETKDESILKRLLHFVTANHRVSLAVSLNNLISFQIVILQGQEFTSRLPTASTCTNTLFLPRYPTIDQLRFCLLTALNQGSVGFGLK